MFGPNAALPDYFVTALGMSAQAHQAMVAAVAPFVDAAISKTVNVPEEYPYADFQDLYMRAWKSGLKGISTYRPNNVLGSVLSVGGETPAAAPAAPAPAPALALVEDNPLRKAFDKRPPGDLESITRKVEYVTSEGKKSVFVTVSFMSVEGIVNGKSVTIERPIDFFVPAGQRMEGQQWVSSTMRTLSLLARSTGFSLAKGLTNLREVGWEKGPVRSGEILRDDGMKVPVYHDSDVAAIGYAMQQILIKRGFLDVDGNPVPVERLAKLYERRTSFFGGMVEEAAVESQPEVHAHDLVKQMGGKKCKDCGAQAVRKIDGCEHCTNCGAVGGCG